LYRRTNTSARIGLVVFFTVWIVHLWNFKIPLFAKLTGVVFDALIIVTLALVLWQFVSSWIERKIEQSIPEGEKNGEESDDERGAAAQRGRSYTLLPIIRKFIGSILIVMVTMTILSSMGVDIGPLLAGAGVVGLAVGFGAQKLVADIFSGFFYLLDDAFRVGEYITAGSVSGAVESISLRNVMLRHHRGMLQIVPHSELGAITNFMRGGIIVKFNLDFPYDADIEKIRKIIKKVGMAMLKIDEFGEDFIKPVKSQGVRQITDSVMTIRVKFTAKPGTHFVIRREAYRRITEALQSQGIHYAHKRVIVDLPNIQAGELDAKRKEQIARAAGAAARAVAEDSKTDQGQSGNGDGK
jgi:small-conductance mechanosensitive channel